MDDYNGDLKLVAYELSALNTKVETIRVNTEASKDRLHEAEKQSALQEQSLQTLCKKVEDLDSDVKDLDSDIERSNLVSKIIGGIAGGLAVIAAAIGISK
jgi:predicted nuclease with TOPRIM domain